MFKFKVKALCGFLVALVVLFFPFPGPSFDNVSPPNHPFVAKYIVAFVASKPPPPLFKPLLLPAIAR